MISYAKHAHPSLHLILKVGELSQDKEKANILHLHHPSALHHKFLAFVRKELSPTV